jgi:hypothetical protein
MGQGASERAAYLVRCEGRIENSPCGLLLAVSLVEKSVCPRCGWVCPAYPAYVRSRTVTKAIL